MAAAHSVHDALTALARRRFADDARVEALRRLSGGASQELWSFDVLQADACHGMVLRRNPGGTVARDISLTMAQEAETIRLAGQAGAPVPRILHVLERADGLGQGFIMERVEGETLAPRILRDDTYAAARPQLARQLGAASRRIHGAEAPALRVIGPSRSLAEAEHAYRARGVARPVVEWALRWLHDHVPPDPRTPVLVHGDLRHGNIVVGAEGLRAILDWEGAHLGDPMEDLGWLCVTSWRFGQIAKPVGGFGTREDLLAGYEAAGSHVDAARVRFWEVLGVLRWGRTCEMMESEFRAGDRSVEKAAIGRRVSETDIDLLAMLAPPPGYRHA